MMGFIPVSESLRLLLLPSLPLDDIKRFFTNGDGVIVMGIASSIFSWPMVLRLWRKTTLALSKSVRGGLGKPLPIPLVTNWEGGGWPV